MALRNTQNQTTSVFKILLKLHDNALYKATKLKLIIKN